MSHDGTVDRMQYYVDGAEILGPIGQRIPTADKPAHN